MKRDTETQEDFLGYLNYSVMASPTILLPEPLLNLVGDIESTFILYLLAQQDLEEWTDIEEYSEELSKILFLSSEEQIKSLEFLESKEYLSLDFRNGRIYFKFNFKKLATDYKGTLWYFKKKKESEIPYNKRIREKLVQKRTQSEKEFSQILKSLSINSEIQYEVRFGRNLYFCDFFLKDYNLIVEIDGEYHFTEEQSILDKIREDNLKSLGFKIIRYKNEEVSDSEDFRNIILVDLINIEK